MRKILLHVALPCLAIIAFGGLYLTPVSFIGCVNRGLIALTVVFVSLGIAVASAARAIVLRRRGNTDSTWFALSAALLAVPAVLVLGPLG